MVRIAPPTSKACLRASGSSDSGTFALVAMTSTARGRFNKNTQRQERPTSTPPTSGPIAEAIPPRPDQRPTPLERSPGLNVASMIAKLPGVNKAPPIPCNRRAPISTLMFGATAHSSDARANQMTPIR